MTTLKTLVRLFFRQLTKSRKREYIPIIILVVYFWFIELFTFLKLDDSESLQMSAESSVTLLLVALLLDFLSKIIFQHDNTVMDPFLKTRPVSRKLWNRFLRLSHCWEPLNLLVPLALLPVWLFCLPFGRALLMFAVSYLFSVAGGIVMMRLKRRGPYPSEKARVRKAHDGALTGRMRMGSVGLQVKGLLRSRRLLFSGVMMAVVFYFYFVARVVDDKPSADVMLLLFLYVFSSVSSQYGFSIEARFFSGLWTRPVPVRRVLEDKYRFSIFLTILGGVLALPVLLAHQIPLWVLWSRMLFVAGAGPLAMLVRPYACAPYDPFNPAHFNTSGRSQSMFNSTVFIAFFLVGLVVVLIHTLVPADAREYLLAGLGIIGYCVRKPYFAWVERCFLKERHKYMEKYNE